MSLQIQLEGLTAKLRSMVPEERLLTIERAVDELKASGMARKALEVGIAAPAFELPDGDGMMWRSADLVRSGPLVAVFYRGRWCAYCNAQLAALQQIHKEIAGRGGSLVAISPQTVKHTYMTRDMHRLRFPVLSDAGNRAARRFGLVYRVPADLQRMYESIMTKLPGYNGDQTWELPLTATYIIGPDGIIKYARINADWRQRAEPEEILSSL
ncbi:MAG TPA: peroxiredoxin-like family protein [Candidatus Angelobacter sp.]|nr:peroxiredoxin-like family protein [Candidatus Angelobacter sp.]